MTNEEKEAEKALQAGIQADLDSTTAEWQFLCREKRFASAAHDSEIPLTRDETRWLADRFPSVRDDSQFQVFLNIVRAFDAGRSFDPNAVTKK